MTEETVSVRALSPARTRTAELVTAALVTAMMAAAAWVTIPLGVVPVTLQVFVVVLAALLLSPGWAASAMSLYLVLGTAGLPIFSGARGGVSVLAGPTGGYLVGFVVGALLGSLLRHALLKHTSSAVADVVSAIAVILVVYVIGTAQLAVVTGMGVRAAIVAGALPFIALDLVKAAVGVAVAASVRKARAAAGV